MASVTWRSSWVLDVVDVTVTEQQLPDAHGGVAALSSLPLRLTRPEGDAAACELTLQWPAQPLRCVQLELLVQCSARHIELHAEGTRRNMLGEEERGETYLGTFRGAKQSALGEEPQLFAMSPAFQQSDRDVLKSLHALRVKFVSLTGDKNSLDLVQFQCVFVPMAPVATVESSAAGLAAKMAGLGVGTAGAAPDVLVLLKGFQQTLEREMETKIARVVDAKLATLSQRLAFSEQALFQLHKKMDAKDANVQASLAQIQQKFSQLEDQLSQLSTAKVEGEKNNEGDYEVDSTATEKTSNTDPDDTKQDVADEVAEAQAQAGVAVAESE
ncbi:uncharacterized protein IUM83_13739 [Phytophthora cinnamomi]|uniref:uncharacterized protein n=1 Tax=Phytophthora cinnamomi TaxID=4785 RepID=UPI0035595194|nr:hypothetical protein IUM83_13739 [Phytophthora cinnamomi]